MARTHSHQGRTPLIFGIAAAVLLVIALVWTQLLEPALVKYPDNVNVKPAYKGTFKVFVNPTTMAPLATPITAPLTIDRHIQTVKSETTSKTAVVDETIAMKAGALLSSSQHNVYVIDRRTMTNVPDKRAYAFTPENQVNRVGDYRVQLPFGVDPERNYSIYKNEIGTTYTMTGLDNGTTYKTNGLTLTRFAGTATAVPLSPAYLSELRKAAPLPESLTLEQLKPQLQAAGIDIAATVKALLPALSAADAATLTSIASKPVPLQYVLSFNGNAGVERTTGSEVDVKATEAVGVRPDAATTGALRTLLAKYPSVPAAASAVTALDKMTATPIPLFEYEYVQTPASLASIAQTVKDQRTMVLLATRQIPFGLLFIGLASALVAIALEIRTKLALGRAGRLQHA